MRHALVLLVACAASDRAPVTTGAASGSAVPAASVTEATAAAAAPASALNVVDGDEPELEVVHSFGGIDLVRSSNFAIHTHGGPPAQLADASINFEVRDRRTHVIEVRKLELLRRHCREDTWHDRKPIAITGHQVYDRHASKPIARGLATVTIPSRDPQRYRVQVGFAKLVEVYQACDIFGYAVALVVDRVPLNVEIALEVTREEPLEQ